MFTPTNFDDIVAQARKELDDEEFRAQVDAAKEKLKAQPRRWFPWRLKITLERRS